jgi:transglutaminase-like putative cysteine protease
LFKIRGASYTRYLRQTVADYYDGRVWKDSVTPSLQDYEGGGLAVIPEGASFQADVEIEFEPIIPFISGDLMTSLYPDSIDFPGQAYYNPEELTFSGGSSPEGGYSWRSTVLSFPPDLLTQTEVSQEPRYLQIPGDISQEIIALSKEITSGIDNPYERAVAIEHYLESNYTYDFDYENAPSGIEPTYWFLFEERRGTCANFANAFVILARASGIAARPVAGFAVSPTDEEQEVMAGQAHQWAEVLFEDLGWVTFEPTPAGGPSDRVPPPTDPIPDPTTTPSPTFMPTAEPTPRPTTVPAVPTITEITKYGGTVQKGEPFTVHGTVTTESGQPVEQTVVDVYVNVIKAHGGTLIGQGIAQQGQFAVESMIPIDLPVGDYQLLARSIANERYQESWSDPPLTVIAPTAIDIEPMTPVMVGDAAIIQGTLREEDSNAPLTNQTVKLTKDGLGVSTRTDDEGAFSFRVHSDSRGEEVYEVRFDGTEFYGASSEKVSVEHLEATLLICEFPKEATLGETLTVEGQLLSQNDVPLPGLKINLGVGAAPTTVETGPAGRFNAQLAPKAAGEQLIGATFSSQDYYAPSSTEDTVRVVSTTSTELPLDDLAVVDQPYPLWGRVRDALGNPVSSGTVSLSSEGEPLGATAVGESGTFLVSYHFPERGTWPIEVQYSGPVHYQASTVAGDLDVMVPTEIVLDLPARPGVNEQVVLTGILMDDDGAGLGGHELRIEVGTDATTPTTDAQGGFSLSHVFPEAGLYSIEVSFGGAGLLLPSSRTVNVEVHQPSLVPVGEAVLVRGEENVLAGKLLLGDQPAEGVTVNAFLDDTPIGSAETGSDGQFQIQYTPLKTEPLGTHGLAYRATRYEIAIGYEIEVKARPELALFASDKVRAGGELRMRALLQDDLGAPLEGEALLVEGFDASAITDSGGSAELALSFPKEAEIGPTTLVATYPGRNGFMATQTEHQIQVLPPAIPWSSIATIAGGALAGLVAIGALGYLVYRHRAFISAWVRRLIDPLDRWFRKVFRMAARPQQVYRPPPPAINWDLRHRLATLLDRLMWWLRSLVGRGDDTQGRYRSASATLEARPADTTSAKESESSRARRRRARRTRIDDPQFPQIQPPFPDVWGTDYPLDVHSRLSDDDGSAIANVPLACEVNGSVAQTVNTDAGGYAQFQLRFEESGEHSVEIVFEGNDDYRPANARRNVRAVDYREEVVRIYHAFLERMRETGTIVPKETTPREALTIIRHTGVDEEALEQLTLSFEEADYSTHEIARKNYEESYLAHLRLAEGPSGDKGS